MSISLIEVIMMPRFLKVAIFNRRYREGFYGQIYERAREVFIRKCALKKWCAGFQIYLAKSTGFLMAVE